MEELTRSVVETVFDADPPSVCSALSINSCVCVVCIGTGWLVCVMQFSGLLMTEEGARQAEAEKKAKLEAAQKAAAEKRALKEGKSPSNLANFPLVVKRTDKKDAPADDSDEEDAKRKKEREEKKKQKEREDSYLDDVLKQLKEHVTAMAVIDEQVVPCFPPEYNIYRFYRDSYKRWIIKVLQFHTADNSKMGKASMLKVVTWLDWYVKKNGKDHEMAEILEELMANYTKSTKERMTTLVDNILDSETKASVKKDGTQKPFTSGPTDLFLQINSQMKLVIEGFNIEGRALLLVAEMCSDLVKYFTDKQVKHLTSTCVDVWLDRDRLAVCSVCAARLTDGMCFVLWW